MKRLARYFEETPGSLRQLILLLYGLVGPVFLAVLAVAAQPDRRAAALAAVAVLIGAGGLFMLVRRCPVTVDWLFPVAFVPIVCCGIAAVACDGRGPAFLVVACAPVAWSAVLLPPVVACAALGVAVATVFTAVAVELGPATALANTALFAFILGLVVWVVLGKAGALRDARQQLAARGARDRALQEATPDILAFADRSGRFLEVHGPAGAALPLPRQALLGRSVYDFLGLEVAGRMRAAVDQAFETGTAQVIEYQVDYPEGPHVFEAHLVRSGADELVVIRRDMTPHRRAELASQRLAAAVEQAPDAIVITDGDGRIEYANPAFEASSGYSLGEALGQNPRILKSGRQADGVYQQLWSTILSGATWRGRLVNRTKAGTLFTEDAVIAPIRGADGAIQAFVAVKRDVTQELSLQQQLIESQKLESLGRLAGGIAHDFNNLLTVILSCGAALEEDLQAGRAPSVADAQEVRAAGERARDLTRQLLAFARRQVLAPRPLDLNEVVRAGEKLLRRVLGEDVALQVDLAPSLRPVVLDASQLEQVILNLAVNARDAMPVGGTLHLATSEVQGDEALQARFPGLGPGSYVRLTVRDTGVGMPPQVLEHLFEPFFTTKAVGQGTGLGLATVYGIVRQSGGFIRAESAPGAGATFEICFPRSDRQAAPAGPHPERSAGGTERLLLVEDDPHVRAVTARMLRSAGYQVEEADGEREALALEAAAGPLHLVISDLVMPERNGRQVVEALRQRRPGLRVLFISGYDASAVSFGRGLDPRTNLLQKPFSGTVLLARVRAVLEAPVAV